MSECEPVIVNPIYHENTIHIINATPLNDPEPFAIAIESDVILVDFTYKCNIINNAKQCLGCMCIISTVMFILFIFFGGLEFFVAIDD